MTTRSFPGPGVFHQALGDFPTVDENPDLRWYVLLVANLPT